MLNLERISDQIQVLKKELNILSVLIETAARDPQKDLATAAERPREEDEYLTLEDVTKRYKVSEATIYRWIKVGIFPKGQLYGPRSRRWKKSELHAPLVAS